MILDNIVHIREDIAAVCQRLGRSADDVVFVGITKYADVSQVQEVVKAGIVHIGENKVQDAKLKFSSLNEIDAKIIRHMVGHLQTNKVRAALEIFDLIESVDSVKLACEIEHQAEKINKQVDILIEVNTSGEEQKFGIKSSEVFLLLGEIVKFKHVKVLGLMTIAPFTEDKEWVRKTFRDLRLLRDEIQDKFSESNNIEMKYLSMGMSGDYEIALEEGSNMVRIGRAMFK